jgi:hypothetical protein
VGSSGSGGSVAVDCGRPGCRAIGLPRTKGRRTKDAHGAPAKGHAERTSADAPFGARQPRHCFCIWYLAVFREAAS